MHFLHAAQTVHTSHSHQWDCDPVGHWNCGRYHSSGVCTCPQVVTVLVCVSHAVSVNCSDDSFNIWSAIIVMN